MKITKNKDHYLLKNEHGEYHISHEQYDSIGKEAAIKLAESEIKIKNESQYKLKTINFEKARKIGFCEYGIRDFCNMLDLDINKSYAIDDLNKRLTLNALKEYPDECIKLFGENTLKYLGGIRGVLSEDTIDLVLRKEFIDEKILHRLSVKFAYQCLGNFESMYPSDTRPRQAIEAKEAWLRGDITDGQLESAESAARSAARSAAWFAARFAARSAAWFAARFAARSAESAAWSAAWSAARSAEFAARSAARSAAWSAARSAEFAARSAEFAARSAARSAQVKIILREIECE